MYLRLLGIYDILVEGETVFLPMNEDDEQRLFNQRLHILLSIHSERNKSKGAGFASPESRSSVKVSGLARV